MGPVRIRTGNFPPFVAQVDHPRPSMGPVRIRTGNLSSPPISPARSGSFNGAGPNSDRKHHLPRLADLNIVPLQWGRSEFGPETRTLKRSSVPMSSLQWGRSEFGPETDPGTTTTL